jgi:hypothetical protein
MCNQTWKNLFATSSPDLQAEQRQQSEEDD